MNIINIDPLKVIPAAWNTRSEIDEASIRSLAESIKADGIIQTPNVFVDEDGDYICYDGNRRVAAACLVGLKEIAVAVNDITEDEARVKTVTANLQREDDDPLLAARVIAELMDGDLRDQAEVVASKLGKTVTWVRRRVKLNNLTDEIKAFVGKVTLEVLERVSDLPADNQKKLAKNISARVKYANGNLIKWREIALDVDRLTMELGSAVFDVNECKRCTERTGADWFADDEEGLGRCLDCACFKQKTEAYKAAKIAESIPADAEKVEVEYEWQIPYEVINDASDKRSKKHPCAYYRFNGAELVVKWGMSSAMIKREREEAEERRCAEREAERAENERADKVSDAILAYVKDEDNCERMIAKVVAAVSDDRIREFVYDAVSDRLRRCYEDIELVNVVEAFSLDSAAIGGDVTDDDLKWFVDKVTAETETTEEED